MESEAPWLSWTVTVGEYVPDWVVVPEMVQVILRRSLPLVTFVVWQLPSVNPGGRSVASIVSVSARSKSLAVTC